MNEVKENSREEQLKNNDLTTYQIYLILLGYLTEQNDNAQLTQKLIDLLTELYRRVDKAESIEKNKEEELKKLKAELDYTKFCYNQQERINLTSNNIMQKLLDE